jgi:hypothetical protein
LAGVVGKMVGGMSRLLDARITLRLPILGAGALLAEGRLAQALLLPLATLVVKRFDPVSQVRCQR